MPWKETDPMTEKEKFAVLARTGRFTIKELCRDFGISRKTGHKYLQRYESERSSEGVKRRILTLSLCRIDREMFKIYV